MRGTPSFGKHNRAATHTICRRCGHHSYFKRKKTCSHCGYGATAKLRQYNWHTRIRAANGNVSRNHRKAFAIKNGHKH